MSEFFLELFSEEIPVNLQKNAREIILQNFKNFFEKENINFAKCSSFSTPNRLIILFEEVDQIEAILNGPIERQIRFDFPYTVVQPGSSITAISEDGLFSIRTKNNSISRSSLIWIEAVNKYAPVKKGNHLSRVYQLQPFQQPLLNPINIAIMVA